METSSRREWEQGSGEDAPYTNVDIFKDYVSVIFVTEMSKL
jgi:hypothetical protein